MLDIASINTPYLINKYSFVNNEYDSYERFFIDEHDEPVAYINIGMDERDLRKIKEKK